MVSNPYLAFSQLIRFDKPIGSLLLLWPTLWGLWSAAQGLPSWSLLVIFVLGVWVMRSAGCIINDIADQSFDGHVERTRHRPLVTGKISTARALMYLLMLLLIAFSLVLMTNRLTVMLAVIGAAVTVLYPYCKRFFILPQAVLGIAFSWGIPMAFAATLGEIPSSAWVLFSAALLWSIAYDTLYAMVDREDDRKIGLYSSAILFGRYDRFWVALLQIAVILILLFYGIQQQLSAGYYLGLVGASGLAVYQQWLIRGCERSACFKAFLNNHWLGASIFMGLVLHYL